VKEENSIIEKEKMIDYKSKINLIFFN
jgi:hypothetical protein